MKKITTTIRTSVFSYVKESHTKKREYSVHNTVPLLIKDYPLSPEVDIPSFITALEERVPKHLIDNVVEVIYVGNFPSLGDRNAAYADGAIYMTNADPTNRDFLENTIHETAHAVLAAMDGEMLANLELQGEFLGKRIRLQSMLDEEGYDFPAKYYSNLSYSRPFDEFLSDVVGYPLLLSLTHNLFVSPYGATSLEEYFANGFENFYLDNITSVKKISPILYNLLLQLHSADLE